METIKKKAFAVGGVLDLSEEDFGRLIMPLSGQWEFYFEALYTPDDFKRGVEQEADYLDVPKDWEQNGKYPLQGYGTYRLVFLMEPQQEVEIYLPVIGTEDNIRAGVFRIVV